MREFRQVGVQAILWPLHQQDDSPATLTAVRAPEAGDPYGIAQAARPRPWNRRSARDEG